ncbi:G-protein coupled receptor 54-like [Branchiostoma floridae x Branchiostoma belcheri]
MSGLFENGSLFGIGDVLPTELVPDTSTEAYNYNASGKDELTGNLSLSTSGTTAAVGAPDLGPEAIVVPTVFAIICAIGIAGNALVIYVVWRYQQMKSVTNYYIVNLAIADIAFLVCCVPFSASVFATTSWNYGLFMCKFVNYFMLVTVLATCLTLAALSFDRYLAIVHPVSSLVYRTKGKAKAISACIWLGSFLASIPVAVYQTEVKGYWYGPQTYCRRQFPSLEAAQGFMVYTVLMSYVIPLMVSATSYILILLRLRRPAVQPEGNNAVIQAHQAQQKRKVAMMVATVVLLFTLSWLPNHVLNLWRLFDHNAPMTPTIHYIKVVALCLSYANSSVNPIVYSFMGEDFRKNFKKAFPKCFKINAVAPANNQLQLAVPGPSGDNKAGNATPDEAGPSTLKTSSTSKDMQTSA